MGRRAPRSAATAVRLVRDVTAPKTGLAAVQSAWAEAVGEQIATVAAPVSERSGTVIVECDSAVWAQELDLMQDSLLAALRERLGDSAPSALSFRHRA
jgi:predicted nucleic acid-binding Zn ribbon protein